MSALLGLPAASATVRAGQPSAAKEVTRTPLLDFAIAGGRHHGLYERRSQIALGDKFRLRREPDNPHDRCAVAVHAWDGGQLGYVPATGNGAVAALIDAGRELECSVVAFLDFTPDTPDWKRRMDGVAVTFAYGGDPRARIMLVER